MAATKDSRRRFNLEKDILLAEEVKSRNPYGGGSESDAWRDVAEVLNAVPLFERPLDERAVKSRFVTLLEEYNARDATNAESLDEEYKYGQLDRIMADIVETNTASSCLAAELDCTKRQKASRRKFNLEKDIQLAEEVRSQNVCLSDAEVVPWEDVVTGLNTIPLFEVPLDVRAVKNRFGVLVEEFKIRNAAETEPLESLYKFWKLDEVLAEVLGVEATSSRRKPTEPQECNGVRVDSNGREVKTRRKFNLEKDVLLVEAVKSKYEQGMTGVDTWKEIVDELNAVPLFDMPLDVRAVRNRFGTLVEDYKARNANTAMSSDNDHRFTKLDQHLADILDIEATLSRPKPIRPQEQIANILLIQTISPPRKPLEPREQSAVKVDSTGRRRKFNLEKDTILAEAVMLQQESGNEEGDAWNEIVDGLNAIPLFEVPLDVRAVQNRYDVLVEEFKARNAHDAVLLNADYKFGKLDQFLAETLGVEARSSQRKSAEPQDRRTVRVDSTGREIRSRRKFNLEKDILLAQQVKAKNPYGAASMYEFDVWRDIVEELNAIPLFDIPLDIRAVRNRFIALLQEYEKRSTVDGGSLDEEHRFGVLDQLMAEILDMNADSSSLAAEVKCGTREKDPRRRFSLEKDVRLAEEVMALNPFTSDKHKSPNDAWTEIVACLNAIPLFDRPTDGRAVKHRFRALVEEFRSREATNAKQSDKDYKFGALDRLLTQILSAKRNASRQNSVDPEDSLSADLDYPGREKQTRRRFDLAKDILLAEAVKSKHTAEAEESDVWQEIIEILNAIPLFNRPLDVRAVKLRFAGLQDEFYARSSGKAKPPDHRFEKLDQLMAEICGCDVSAPLPSSRKSQERPDSQQDQAKFQREAGLFADFVMLVVPKVGQENARWKYDVQNTKKMLTVYRLSYKNQVAVVSDCLCLQFRTDPSDPLAYSMIPTLSVGGKPADPSFVAELLGKSTLTSPVDLQTVLDQLVEDQENIRPTSNDLPHPRNKFTAQLTSLPSLLERRRKRKAENSFSTGKKKRTMEECEDGSMEADEPLVAAAASNLKSRKSSERKEDRSLYRKRMRKRDSSLPAPILSDALFYAPVHSSLSGGTIFSSQYWTNAAPSRERLKSSKTIFVETEFLSDLPDRSETAEGDQFDESVKYGRLLVEHLLGGSEAISRSFAYSSSGTCPITKEELLDHVYEILDAVLEHIRISFSLDKAEDVRKAILSALRPKMNVSYKEHTKTVLVGRKPSDIFLREHLTQCSYPDPQKSQVAHGFDFYVDKKMLKDVEKSYKDGSVQTANPYGRYGMDVIVEVVGGLDVYREGLKHVHKGGMALLGDDIIEAVYLRTKQTFGLDDSVSLSDFRTHVSDCHLFRARKFHLGECTGVMASVLFPPDVPSGSSTLVVPAAEDPAAKPGCNYWMTPVPHRTRLSLNSSFYMNTVKLAEYQRYMGPESARKNKDWTVYLKCLMHHATGGEERFMKKLLEKQKAKESLEVLERPIRDVIAEHVVDLFKAPEVVSLTKVQASMRDIYKNELALYDKGVTRWYFPELDERPKPETVALLEEQEYWRKPAADRTQLRPGHEVYIKTALLDSVASYFGPQGKDNDIKKYAYAVLVHMLGGRETAWKLWKDRKFVKGLQGMFVFDDLIAVCLHADKVYHLTVTISPLALLRYACDEVHQYESQQATNKRKAAEGSRSKPPRSLLHKALDVT